MSTESAVPVEGGTAPPETLFGKLNHRISQVFGKLPSLHFWKCLTLQIIGAAIVLGLWLEGIAQKPFEEGKSTAICGVVILVALWGIIELFRENWKGARWVAKMAPVVGLLGTVVGLAIAFSAAADASADQANAELAKQAVYHGMFVSLYGTMFGLITNVWLRVNARLLTQQYE